MNPAASMRDFAQKHILTRTDLGRQTAFPMDIWHTMGQKGLLDSKNIAAQGKASGTGPCTVFAQTARVMTASGGNLGLTLSWIIHHLTAYYILAPHNSSLFSRMKPVLKTGEATLSFSVSEPKAGGHPKYMRARAEESDQGYALFGEKTYLTNGPIAKGFIVVAITGQSGDKKEFSAFLVERDCPGLSLSDPMNIPFFNPSPHGGITMEGCRVDKAMMVGEKGRAFPDLVLPFRQFEDALMTGAVTGAMAFILKVCVTALSSTDKGPEVFETLGKLEAMLSTALLISDRITEMADNKNQDFQGLHLYFRELGSDFTSRLDHLIEVSGIQLPDPAQTLAHDLKSSAAIGNNIARLRLQKLGRNLIGY